MYLENGELPIGNVILTSVGRALQAITDSVEIEDYYEMVKDYMSNNRVKFAEKHEFFAEINDSELKICRKNS